MHHNKHNNTKRCAICDTTNNLLVQNLPGQYKKYRRGKQDFVPDPKSRIHVICIPCNDIIEQVRQEFLIKDLQKEFEIENVD